MQTYTPLKKIRLPLSVATNIQIQQQKNNSFTSIAAKLYTTAVALSTAIPLPNPQSFPNQTY